MSSSITLFQAIQIWLSGQEIDRNAVMWGLDVTWWSRIAKVGQFLGGATAVLDIVGPTKVRSWSNKLYRLQRHGIFYLVFFAGVFALAFVISVPIVEQASRYFGEGILLFAVSLVSAGFVILLLTVLLAMVIDGLSSPKSAKLIRVVALLVFSTSFLLDLLTS